MGRLTDWLLGRDTPRPSAVNSTHTEAQYQDVERRLRILRRRVEQMDQQVRVMSHGQRQSKDLK